MNRRILDGLCNYCRQPCGFCSSSLEDMVIILRQLYGEWDWKINFDQMEYLA